MPLFPDYLTLTGLPPPIIQKTGWPWTEESVHLPDVMTDGRLWPRVSIVIPLSNQAEFGKIPFFRRKFETI